MNFYMNDDELFCLLSLSFWLILGTLKGFDNVVNLVIKDSHERVFSPTEGVEQVPLGLFIIRGQNPSLVTKLLFLKLKLDIM
ncbi:unnamed protein product [Schistosoma margrebowiei]|uniref:Uncharacterized protein n=1 Tax=Schistosoma margrebowiei TaxID=48269 RepID=A0A183N2P4_9TREM|nr:unnamed protein product [Schistosoma margrebowiei]